MQCRCCKYEMYSLICFTAFITFNPHDYSNFTGIRAFSHFKHHLFCICMKQLVRVKLTAKYKGPELHGEGVCKYGQSQINAHQEWVWFIEKSFNVAARGGKEAETTTANQSRGWRRTTAVTISVKEELGLKLSWISAAVLRFSRSGDCDVTKGCSPSYQEWGRAGKAPAPGGGGCLELSLSWVDTTGRPFAQHKAAPDRWWQLRETKRGTNALTSSTITVLLACVSLIYRTFQHFCLQAAQRLLTAAGMHCAHFLASYHQLCLANTFPVCSQHFPYTTLWPHNEPLNVEKSKYLWAQLSVCWNKRWKRNDSTPSTMTVRMYKGIQSV